MMNRFPVNRYFDLTQWSNWEWHEKNAVNSVDGLQRLFPNMSKEVLESIELASKQMRFKVTPYMLSLIEVDEFQNPIPGDPIWNQFIPTFSDKYDIDNSISTLDENWEMPEDMITPILQHKYYNRVNFRIQNKCLAYCVYCFEAKRIIDKKSVKGSLNSVYYDESIKYIAKHHEITEVVISGGEPFSLSNESLECILSEIRKITHVVAIRIQTRSFVHNPFRLDDQLISLLKKYDVTAMAFHVSHPCEISYDAKKVIEKFSDAGCRTMLLAHIPLLKDVNDANEILLELFMELYSMKIKPYYLIHAMPDTYGANKFRTSVRKGVQILRQIKRYYSNPALPEYIIVHKKGKHTVPLEIDGTSEFLYKNGFIEFYNWKGERCVYEDCLEKGNSLFAAQHSDTLLKEVYQ